MDIAMDLSPFVGNPACLDGAQQRELINFLHTTMPVAVGTGKMSQAGWIWRARFADLGLMHEPIKVLTVVGAMETQRVYHVGCMVMLGQIDHLLKVTDHGVLLMPLDEPAAYRESLRATRPDWWSCPYGGKRRCACLQG
jgi:hypothetical protein